MPRQQRRVFSEQLLQAFDVVVVNRALSLRCRPLQTLVKTLAHFCLFTEGLETVGQGRDFEAVMSLRRKIPQEIRGRGQVIVPGDGIDLPLAQLSERLGLNPLRTNVGAVVGQHVVGEFGRPFEFSG